MKIVFNSSFLLATNSSLQQLEVVIFNYKIILLMAISLSWSWREIKVFGRISVKSFHSWKASDFPSDPKERWRRKILIASLIDYTSKLLKNIIRFCYVIVMTFIFISCENRSWEEGGWLLLNPSMISQNCLLSSKISEQFFMDIRLLSHQIIWHLLDPLLISNQSQL